MGPDVIYITSYHNERYIADQPWMIVLKRRKAGIPSSIDAVVDTTCDNRSSYKLLSIDPFGRSCTEMRRGTGPSTMQRRTRASQHLKKTDNRNIPPRVLLALHGILGAKSQLRDTNFLLN